jgi:hypothetical protein
MAKGAYEGAVQLLSPPNGTGFLYLKKGLINYIDTEAKCRHLKN